MINLSTAAFYDHASRQISGLRGQANELQVQIGSGERLSRSSDDPVAAARLRTLDRRERLSEIDQLNSDRAMDDLQLTEQALSSMVALNGRAKELAMQAANGSLGAEQRQLLRAEVDGVRESMLMVANSRNSAGLALFGGQAAGLAYDDTGTGLAYVGTATAESVGIGDGQSVTRALTGPEVFAFSQGGASSDLFVVLGTLSAALQDPLADHTAAGHAAMDGIDAGLETITTAQTIIGSRMGWVEVLSDRRVMTGALVADERADIGGADLATTMTRLQEVMTILEASQSSFVTLSNLSLFDQLR